MASLLSLPEEVLKKSFFTLLMTLQIASQKKIVLKRFAITNIKESSSPARCYVA